jgi:hypothetical protein
MTDTPLLETPVSRRSLLRGAVAGAGGLTLASLGLTVTGKTARASSLYSIQADWAWCSLCSQAYYATGAFRGSGDCPKQPGDGHAAPGWHYSMVYGQGTTGGLPGTPGYQNGWRWCQYCYSPYWPGTNAGGQCVASRGNGSHSPGASFSYAMPVGLSGGYQGGWSPCAACSTLYHSGSGSGTDWGYCYVNANRFGGKVSHSHNGSWPYVLIVNST